MGSKFCKGIKRKPYLFVFVLCYRNEVNDKNAGIKYERRWRFVMVIENICHKDCVCYFIFFGLHVYL